MQITDDINWQSKYVLGVEWDRSSSDPALTRIDVNGDPVGTLSYDIDTHPIYSRMWRCTLTDEGIATYGSNARGDGLTLNGSAGRVMGSIPRYYVKIEHPSSNIWRWWLSPTPYDGFVLYPAFLQSHATKAKGLVKEFIYIGAYDASLKYKALPDNTIQFDSRYEVDGSGVACTQPIVGGSATRPCTFDVAYTAGCREFVVGETLTNNTEDAEVHDWTVTGGAFGAGTAAGHLLMQVHDDPWGGGNWAAGNIADSGANVIATSGGAPTHLTLNMTSCRAYSETNIGGRWGFMNIWTFAAIQMLYLMEYANFWSQSTTYGIGEGVTMEQMRGGYGGWNCGADSANTAIGTNGTGNGTGAAGKTPMVYRGIENLWGNVYKYVDGYNALDASYNIIKADGTGTFANTITAGNYDASSMAPLTNPGGGRVQGYASSIEFDDLMKFFFIPSSESGGSSNKYLTDYFYSHFKTQTNILIAGGAYWDDTRAGVTFLCSRYTASLSDVNTSTRLEFV